ncbi:MAG TPA: hypothetical protein VNQ77_10495 [Frankiaceae bacterium]|nr:hypothetical protein [Frankiaceae bacterium]
MRRLLAATVLAAAALEPAASAQPDLPCDGWVHGCYVPAYVYDVCERRQVDCGIIP